MIPPGGDQSFYDSYDPSERSEDNNVKGWKESQANPTTPPGEKKTETPTSNGGRKRKASGTNILRYPFDIMEDHTDFLHVQVLKYNPPGLGEGDSFGLSDETTYVDRTGEKPITRFRSNTLSQFNVPDGTSANPGSKKDILKNIFLPIPKNIGDSNRVDWGDGRINALEAFGLKFGQTFLERGPIEAAEAAFNASKGAFQNPEFTANAKNAFINAISAQAISALGGQVRPGDLISRATGQILNPNLELLFRNVLLREFKFAFDFFPRNKREATEVMHIIRCFKAHSAAKRNSGVFLGPPDIFQLTYRKGATAHPFLNKFKPTVLTNMTVNYTGSNTYSTFYDGTPVHMIMELSFKELNPIYEENYWEEEAEQFNGNFDLANPENSFETVDAPTGGVGY